MRFTHSSRRRLAAFAVIAALAVGAFAVPAFAQSASEDSSESTSESTTPDATMPDGRFGDRQAALAEALAAELDLPVEHVTDALEAAREKLSEQRQEQRATMLRELSTRRSRLAA